MAGRGEALAASAEERQVGNAQRAQLLGPLAPTGGVALVHRDSCLDGEVGRVASGLLRIAANVADRRREIFSGHQHGHPALGDTGHPPQRLLGRPRAHPERNGPEGKWVDAEPVEVMPTALERDERL